MWDKIKNVVKSLLNAFFSSDIANYQMLLSSVREAGSVIYVYIGI